MQPSGIEQYIFVDPIGPTAIVVPVSLYDPK